MSGTARSIPSLADVYCGQLEGVSVVLVAKYGLPRSTALEFAS